MLKVSVIVVRSFFAVVVGVFTSRVVLQLLGVDGYGGYGDDVGCSVKGSGKIGQGDLHPQIFNLQCLVHFARRSGLSMPHTLHG